jgi:methionyl-tRNA synthetase
MVFGQDASYSDEAFVERYNSDLANDLGNTVSRVVTLARRAFDGRTPHRPDHGPSGSGRLSAAAEEAIRSYRESMDEAQFSRALEALSRLLAETNSYLVDNAPWKAMKDEARLGEVGEVLWNALEAVRVVATALLPVMPTVAREVLASIGAPLQGDETPDLRELAWGGPGTVPSSGDLPEIEGLFPRIDKDKYLKDLTKDSEAAVSETETTTDAPTPETEAAQPAERPADPQISIDQFFETVLRVGTVRAAEKIPKSSKLVKLTVDLGEASPRTVVAGIAKGYSPEDLEGRQVVIVANLQPAKLMGVESQGMVLAASDGTTPILLHPDQEVAPGTQVK